MFFSSSSLSAINFANREPFMFLLPPSWGSSGRSSKEGPSLDDKGGANAHTEDS